MKRRWFWPAARCDDLVGSGSRAERGCQPGCNRICIRIEQDVAVRQERSRTVSGLFQRSAYDAGAAVWTAPSIRPDGTLVVGDRTGRILVLG